MAGSIAAAVLLNSVVLSYRISHDSVETDWATVSRSANEQRASEIAARVLHDSPGMLHSGSPSVTPDSDCAIRELAYNYGKHLAPSQGDFQSLFDAMQLGACNVTAPKSPRTKPVGDEKSLPAVEDPLPPATPHHALIFVAPHGAASSSDVVSIRDAIQHSRVLRTKHNARFSSSTALPFFAATIVLRAGTHFIGGTSPIQLGREDSHLTLRSAPGVRAVVSGGVPLSDLEWTSSTNTACAASKGCFQASLKDVKQLPADVLGLRRNGVREIRARYPNYDPELSSVIDGNLQIHDGREGWIASKTSWIPQTAAGQKMNGISPWPPTTKAQTIVINASDWPGVEWPMQIMTTLPNGTTIAQPDGWTGEGDWGEYWVGIGGTCIDRSPPAGYWCAPAAPRHISTPNHPSGVSPTEAQLPNLPYTHAEGGKGAVIHAWRPGHWYTNIFEVATAIARDPSKPTAWEIFPNINAVRGKCKTVTSCDKGVYALGTFNSTNECWAAANASAVKEKYTLGSFTYHQTDFGVPWGSHCYAMDSTIPWSSRSQEKIDSGRGPVKPLAGADFLFGRGGIQGGEGVTDGEAWYVENVLEELDIGREWYYDQVTTTLYYMSNETTNTAGNDAAPGAPTGNFVATSLATLFEIKGTQAAPAHHIAITGVTLRDTRYTYFDPHGLPSGGDWGLQKQGAITMVGTENVTIGPSNLFTRLDGNAVFIGGYNRGAVVTTNEFVFIGDNVIAQWGDTSAVLNENKSLSVPGGWKIGPDGRGGDQPRGTKIIGNVAHEIGLWQKQSSLYFQAVSAETIVQGNVFFNGPRAALNFNDGFGGGDIISNNMLANTCRESSDHGPWNSWDRVPYITTLRHGKDKPSIIPKNREIHHNLVVATYNSQESIDTDDGSAYIDVHHNFFAYGDNGLKSDFGGHDEYWHENQIAYVGNCYHMWNFKGYNDGFFNNSCITRSVNGGYDSDCKNTPEMGWEVHDNTVYTSGGTVNACGSTLAEWVKQGHDKGSKAMKWPTDAEMTARAKVLLDF